MYFQLNLVLAVQLKFYGQPQLRMKTLEETELWGDGAKELPSIDFGFTERMLGRMASDRTGTPLTGS